ncbi:Glycosyltransferase [Klebsiella aerogenes EA1509E]|nr:Glycosyltransferase [Klebsiella aerogenes EA1509E]
MRVLHVYKTYYPDTYGGIEQVIYQLSQGCARRGIAADVFTFSPDKETGPVDYEDHRVIYNKQLFEIASTPFSLKALKRFKQIKDDYDIINYHFPFPFMDMLHLSARPDARTVVTYHSDIVKQKRLMKLYQPLQQRFLASVDCIVASSPNYVASSQTLKKYQDKTVVIPFDLDSMTCSTIRRGLRTGGKPSAIISSSSSVLSATTKGCTFCWMQPSIAGCRW